LDATVEQCRFYGVNGQAQKGIDLYARQLDGSYKVVQCKRSSDGFTPSEVTKAVDTFLAGDWAGKAGVFVLAVTANLEGTQAADRIEDERPKLARRGITFVVWDETEISAVLKDHPQLVDDFFGREAVRTFLGDDAADALADRLDATEVIEYRNSLGHLYREVFSRLERGVHGDDRNVPLDDRFVLPDVLVTDSAGPAMPVRQPDAPTPDPAATAPRSGATARYFPDVTASLRNPALTALETRSSPDHYGNRVKATDWLTTGNQHLVVGVPGSGKSALLRTLVLDVFADAPRLIGQVDRLHGMLPVWLPFAFWTNAARKNANSVSVLDAVRDWLNAYDHGHLWPLIEKALRDERVLLVVDGLDEWASPDLARMCIDRLEVFASTKRASVLASSRPFSTADLPVDGSRWRLGTLAPLDHEQRLTFVTKWLAPLVAEPALAKEAAEWASEIESSAHLRELSDLPLFLLLLLRSREQQTEFPEDLYAVLSEAITRLIGEHRRRKIDTSGAADLFPSSGDIRKVSAATAEHMHASSMIAISDDKLREEFRRTLAESVGYPAAEAHAMAIALVSSLSPGIGLMVRPAPDETRFFHRSVLEFLAAERLLTRPSDEQVGLFRDHLTDRRWSQVLRFLVRGLVRPPEIAAIFDALDEASVGDPLLREGTDLLAADVAVSAGHAEAQTRRRLLDGVMQEIETGERTAHRAQLLDRLVVGLSRREIRSDLEHRFGAWLRGVSRETWSSVLSAASTWEPDDTLLGMLWHALLDDNDEVHRVACRVIGAKFAGHDVGDRLVKLATTTRLPHRRAAATEALSLGWPDHPALDPLIATGREHPDFAVRHASVAADLRRGNATDANRSLLIDLLDHAPSITSWSGGLMDLMVQYYPDDQTIFDHYVPNADPTTNDQIRYGAVPATFLILKGYTRRPEAQQYFLKFIGPHRKDFPTTPSNLTDRIPWKEIGEVYRGDAAVVAAVEALVREYDSSSFHNRDIYFCSQVARTHWLRDKLIARVQGRDAFGIGWAIKALTEGWPDDPMAQEALAEIVDPAAGDVPNGAVWYLPAIITDPNTALDRLAHIAPGIDSQGTVVAAVNDIVERGASRDDPRVIAIVEHALDDDMTSSWTSPEAALYAGFPDHARVRALAQARLDDRDAPLDKIAYGFRSDLHMRQEIAARLRPLSPPLRGRLVEILTETPLTDAAVTALLARYDTEPDPAVKLLTATAYARRLKSTDAVTDQIVETFTEQARAVGHDHYERRAAAFCALAELGRLDRLTNLRDHISPGKPVQIHHSHLGDQALFYRYICHYWHDVKANLGDDFPHRFGFENSSESEFWQNILAVAHDYPATRDDLVMKLDQKPELVQSAAAVSYLSRIEQGTDRLWDATTGLLKAVHARSYHDIQPAWTALHVVAHQFANDPRTDAWLDSELANIEHTKVVHDGQTFFRLPSFGTVAAIARHRPDHPFVPQLLAETARTSGQPWHTFHEWAELAAATVPDAAAFIDLAIEISRLVQINDMFAEYIHRPLTARLRRDGSLATAIAELVPSLSGTATGIAVRLLALSGRLNGPLVDHLRSRLASRSHETVAETFDPFTGQSCRIELLILDVLDTIST
jgi:hypothetical protein